MGTANYLENMKSVVQKSGCLEFQVIELILPMRMKLRKMDRPRKTVKKGEGRGEEPGWA